MVPILLSNEQGRELSGNWNLKGKEWLPLGSIGTWPSALSEKENNFLLFIC